MTEISVSKNVLCHARESGRPVTAGFVSPDGVRFGFWTRACAGVTKPDIGSEAN